MKFFNPVLKMILDELRKEPYCSNKELKGFLKPIIKFGFDEEHRIKETLIEMKFGDLVKEYE